MTADGSVNRSTKNLDFDELDQESKKALVARLDELDLSVRASNALRVHNCMYVGDLVGLADDQFLCMRNFGKKCLDEVHAIVETFGLKSGTPIKWWSHSVAEKIRSEITDEARQLRTDRDSLDRMVDQTIDLATASHKLKVSLVRRVEELGLSTRLSNCLLEKQCEFLGDVVTVNDAQFLRSVNLGRKSLRELHSKLRHFGLKTGLSLRGWDHEIAQALRNDLECEVRETWTEGTETGSGLASQTLEQELMIIANTVTSDRNVEIIGKLWGWLGDGLRTLESVGQEYGLTRERVRQIAAKSEKKIRKLPAHAPKLKETLMYLEEHSPDTSGSLEAALLSSGITSSLFRISGILNAAIILDIECVVREVRIDQFRFIITNDSEFYTKVVEFARLIRARSRPHGCTNFEAVLDELEIEGENDRQSLFKFVRSNPDFIWLDQEKKWLWDIQSSEVGRNRIVNIIRKIFSLTPSLHVSELRQALNRYHRISYTPPIQVLLGLCRHLDFLDVVENQVSTKSGATLSSTLSGLEETLIAAFQGEPVFDRATLEANALALGMNRSSFYVMIGYSPIVVLLSRGVYAPIGAKVPPGAVEANQPTIDRGKRIVDFGWRDSRYIWIAYNLTKSLMRDGLASVPASLKEFLQGEWPIEVTQSGRTETVTIDDTRVYGFGKFLDRRGAEVGDTLVLAFDTKEGQFHLELGGEELLERYQGNEFDLTDDQVSELDADDMV